MSETVLEMQHIDKAFFNVKVLDDVSIDFRVGEVHAIVGENGAGKSTLMKILMGIYHKDAGKILMNGHVVDFQNPREALNSGIAMIHQELNPVQDMEVAEYIFIGREIHTTHMGGLSLVDHKAQRRETKRLLDEIGADINPHSLMRHLSVAQVQLVEIIKAISLSSRVIIMDEPTSAITYKEVETLFKQIKFLKSKGVTIIYISHKMDEIFRIADRVTVLRDGKLIATEDAKNLTREKTIKMMVGREITEIFPKAPATIGEVALEVRNLSLRNKYQDINFKLHHGEILGVAGLVGAGRSELVESIFGIQHFTSGEVLVNGRPLKIRHPKDAIKTHIALITEDRALTGLNLKSTVEYNISIVQLRHLAEFGIIKSAREAQAVEERIRKGSIKVRSRKSMMHSLSGGNQQKVVLAKWLLSNPDIIILDEPTRGIDVGAKRDIYLLMGALATAGKAILMISSEIPELMGVADRIIVLAAGRLTGELARQDFTQENIMKYASKFEALHE